MKTVWILNHYATDMFLEHGGRHYCFAKYLIRSGWKVRIFCADTVHNSTHRMIQDGGLFDEQECDGIPFVFVRARSYAGNGKQRVLNMLDFYRNVQKAAGGFERPDVIVGSSVHPLTCVAAIRLAKRYRCRVIAEIRDLWPESIVAFGIRKKSDPLIQALYRLEKWIYTKADAIIFTMEGGRDYIIEKGWDKQTHGGPVDLDKVHHINNGVDLEAFDYNREQNTFPDADLDAPDIFKVVYTGSIRKANGLDLLVECAKMLRNNSQIKIIVFGAGEELDKLKAKCQREQLKNISFKGGVPKRNIPSILSRANLNVLNYGYNAQTANVYKYGGSQNKLFEYLASGKPIISNVKINYSVVEHSACGEELSDRTSEKYAEAILRFSDMPGTEYRFLCDNARRTAADYDFKNLTEKFLKVIEAR